MKIIHVLAAALFLMAALLIAYGIFALRAAERSAAHGGGLLGGFGILPLGLGIVGACVAGLLLALERLIRRKR